MKNFVIYIVLAQLVFANNVFAQDCGPGMEMKYNRCVMKQETLEQQARGNQCANAEDPQKCFKEMANKDISSDRQETGDDYDISKFGKMGQAAIHIAMIVVSGYVLDFWISRGSGRMTCKPASMYVMTAAASALLVTEIMSYITYSKKVKKRKEEVSQFVTPDEESAEYSENAAMKDYTVMAYDSIILQEKAYLAANKTRRTGYAIATGAFGAAAAVAAGETFTLKAAKAKMTAALANTDTSDDQAAIDFYNTKREKLVCSKVSKGSSQQKANSKAKNDSKNARSGGNGGMLTSMIPMLILPLASGLFSSVNNESPDTYVNLDDLYNQSNFNKLPNALQSDLINIKNIDSVAVLNSIIQEKEMLSRGESHSPSLMAYEKDLVSFNFMDSEVLEQTKSALMIQETFKEQLGLIEVLGEKANSTVSL